MPTDRARELGVGDVGDGPLSTEAGSSDGEAPGVAAVDIVSVPDGFDPATITVDVGTEVVWTNIDGVSHTTTAQDGEWDSGNLGQGESFTFAASEAGTFGYFCAIHPSMVGEIVVESSDAVASAGHRRNSHRTDRARVRR